MPDNAPILNLLAPFLAAFAVCAFGTWKRALALPIAILGLSISFVSSLVSLWVVATGGPITYTMGGWSAPIGIVFSIDALNALVVVLIHLVALMALFHSARLIEQEIDEKRHFYYTLYLLFVTGITGITQTADAFNLYVLIEVASLTSYALIAMGERRSLHAGLNYLLMGSIGATLYLLGVGFLYLKTGTLNMHDLHAMLTENRLFQSPTVQVATILIIVGLWLKMAMFPFHGWLPNAYTWSPVSSAALMAPLMTKVMIYVMIRMMLVVFGLDQMLEIVWAKTVPYLAVMTILFGSFMALSQRNLRRIFTYIIVAEVGYMVGAAWLGNTRGLTGSFYHILSDSLMTLCLFLGAGSLVFKHKIRSIDDLEGIFSKMPLTMTAFTVGAISMIGIPPTCGFFSKWYLIGGGIEAGNWIYVGALILSSFINAVIFFRMFEIACFGKNPVEEASHDHEDTHEADHHPETSVVEAPPVMVVPVIVISLCIILLGVFNQPVIEMIQHAITSIHQGGIL